MELLAAVRRQPALRVLTACPCFGFTRAFLNCSARRRGWAGSLPAPICCWPARNSPNRCCSAASSTCSPASLERPAGIDVGLAPAGGLGGVRPVHHRRQRGVALHADRLAHRQRQAVLTNYFEHIMQLPLTFHTGTHSGRLMKVMLNGTDALWRLWLGFFREHFAAIMSLVVLLPLALYINWRLAILLFVLVRGVHGADDAGGAQDLRHAERGRGALQRSVRARLRRARQRRAGAELRAHRCRGAGPALRRRQAARGADAGIVVVGAGHRHHAGVDHHHGAGDLHRRHRAACAGPHHQSARS